MTLRAHLDGTILAEHVAGRSSPSPRAEPVAGPPPLLALHGWGRDRHDLLPLLAGMGHRSVAVDLPGFGSSPPPPEAWGAALYAASVGELIDEIGGGPYLVVGHSFGGRVAVALAVDYPHHVAGLVLSGVPFWRSSPAPRPALRYRLVRKAARLGIGRRSLLEAARWRYGSSDYRAVHGVMRDVLVRVVNEEYRDSLGRVEHPAGLVWGESDTATPARIATEAARILPWVVTVDIVKGAGHDVHQDAPERVARAIEEVSREAV